MCKPSAEQNDECKTTGISQQSAEEQEMRPKTSWSAKTLHTMELWLRKEHSGLGCTSQYQPWSSYHHSCSHLLSSFLALNAKHQELLHSYYFYHGQSLLPVWTRNSPIYYVKLIHVTTLQMITTMDFFFKQPKVIFNPRQDHSYILFQFSYITKTGFDLNICQCQKYIFLIKSEVAPSARLLFIS